MREKWLSQFTNTQASETPSQGKTPSDLKKQENFESPPCNHKASTQSNQSENEEKTREDPMKATICKILDVDVQDIDLDNLLNFFIEKTSHKTPQSAMNYMLMVCARCKASPVKELEKSILENAYLMIQIILSENDVSIFPPERNYFFSFTSYEEILKHIDQADAHALTHYTLTKWVADIKKNRFGQDPHYLIQCLIMFTNNPIGAKIVVDHDLWDRKDDMTIADTILGACLSLLFISDPETFKTLERSIRRRDIEEGFSAMRSYTNGYMELFKKLVQNLKQVDKSIFLDWYLKNIVKDPGYKKRSGLYHQLQWRMRPELQKQEGLHINLHTAFMMLCQQFSLEADLTKMKKIVLSIHESFLYKMKHEYDLEDEPVICNDETQEDPVEDELPAKFNMLTKLFFSSHLHMYRGFISCLESYRHLSSLVENLRAQASVSSHHESAYLETYANQLSLYCFIFDPKIIQNTFSFINVTSHWLCELMDRKDSNAWKKIPEFIITNVAHYLVLISQRLLGMDFHRFDFTIDYVNLLFAVKFLSKEEIKSQHLKNSVLEALIFMTCPHLLIEGDNVPKIYNSFLEESEEAMQTLIPSMIKFYVDIEISDSPNNYYQKYSTRYKITLLIKHLRSIPQYHKPILDFVEKESLFKVFMRRLISDATYLLDELVEKLPKIRHIENEKKDQQTWNQQPAEYRAEREQELAQMEQVVSASSRLANQSIDLLHYLSQFDVETLKDQDISSRLAVTLCYFLRYFAGPRRKEMVTGNKDKLNFKPRYILALIIETFVYFHEKGGAFDDALIQDNRSLDMDIFEEAIVIVHSKSICSHDMAIRFENLVDTLREKLAKKEFIPDEEIPEEFLDPLVCSLMEDPVILPSGMSMDRRNILRHLESNPTDPFNRQPLTEDLLVSNVELKSKIEEWKKNRLAS